jgi:plastocyanin
MGFSSEDMVMSRTYIRVTLGLLFVALIAIVAMALASANVAPVPEVAAQSPATTTIRVHDNYFQPPIVHVMPGGSVRWINAGTHSHTVTTQDGRDFVLAPGGSMELTFYSAGRLQYPCRFHALQRMSGTIIVGAAP